MAGSLILDIILVAVAAFIIFKYTIAGFLKSVLNFVKVIAAILLAVCFRLPVATIIDDAFMGSAIRGWVYTCLTKTISGADPVVNFIGLNSDTPQFFEKVLSKFGLDYEKFNSQIYELSEDNIESLTEQLGGSISLMLSSIIAVIVIFIVSILLLSLVVRLLNNLTKISGIRALNKLLGLGLGAVIAIVAVWALGAGAQTLVNMLSPLFPDFIDQSIIDNSMVLGFLEKVGINIFVKDLTTKLTA